MPPPPPDDEIPECPRRAVIVDGLNLAFWAGPPPGLRLPLAALQVLRAAGHAATAVFDASTRHRLAEAERPVYAALLALGTDLAIEVAAGRSADPQLLRLARDRDALILSRDRFKDHRRRFRRIIDVPGRIVDGHLLGTSVDAASAVLRLPALGLDQILAESASEALAALRASIAR